MDEHHLTARERPANRRLHGGESINELVRDIEREGTKIPSNGCVLEKVSFQLKLLQAQRYIQTIAKATELLLIYKYASVRRFIRPN